MVGFAGQKQSQAHQRQLTRCDKEAYDARLTASPDAGADGSWAGFADSVDQGPTRWLVRANR